MLQSECNEEMLRNLKRVADSSARIADALEMLVGLQRVEPKEDHCENCSTKHELEVNLKKWANAYERGLEAGRKEAINNGKE